jgi:hypothetical protein
VFKNYDFDLIKKSVNEKTPIEAIKNILQINNYKFDDKSLSAYRHDCSQIVRDSLHLISYNQLDSIQDFEALENKSYKEYEGKLDKSPRNGDKRSYGSESLKFTMFESDTSASSPEAEMRFDFGDSDEEDQFIYDQDIYQQDPMTHRISVADSYTEGRFESITNKSNDESNPLEMGMLFTILFKKIGRMLTNTKTENVLVTSILSKLSSIPLSEDNPATYYLHAFMYLELKNKSMGLLNTMRIIAEAIHAKTKFENFDKIKEIAKNQLELPADSNLKFDSNTSPKSKKELEAAFQANQSVVHGSIIFEEFIKEYISIFEAKKYIIDMMSEFEAIKAQDIGLDQAISKLRKPIQVKM